MNLKKQEIINLPVFTQSGENLGRVVDFEVSSDTHQIEKYIVRSGLMAGGILQKDLLISPTQVISMTNEKMEVEDTLTREEALKKATTTA